MGVYINIDVKEIMRGAVAVLNIDDVAFFVKGKDIIAVPDHGDLIDRDALIENAGMCMSDFGTPDEQWRPDRDWYLTINAQTIIIPAKRSEEECEDENWYTELDDPKFAERSEE